MLKYLFTAFQALVWLFAAWFGQEDLSVTSNIPKQMNAGEDVAIEITVHKGDLAGNGSLVMELPQGLTIKEKELNGSEFLEENGKAEWKWNVLPSQESFTLKVTLSVDKQAFGPKAITAFLSYPENGEQQQVDMTPVEIEVQAAPATASTDTIARHEKEPEVAVTSSRTTSMTPQGDMVVTIVISKGNTSGFGRYSDLLSKNIKAKAIQTDGASFSVADGRLKFVWVSVPSKSDLTISYILTSKDARDVVLDGEYVYVEANQTKKHKMKEDRVEFRPDLFNKPTETTPTVAAAEPTSAPAAEPTKEKPKKESKKSRKADRTKEMEEAVVNADKAVFMVQLGAFNNNKVTVGMMRKRFGIKDVIRTEMANGMVKFIAGSFVEYNEARDQREVYKNQNKVKTAFVVAYNQGKRITVQEGLSLNKQKWVK